MGTLWPATLASYCQRLTASRVDAEDLAQQTLLKALPVVTGQPGHPNPDAYLRHVAKNLWIDQGRSAKHRERLTDEHMLDVLAGSAVGDPLEKQLQSDDIAAAFQVLLSVLTPLERTALLLHDVYVLTANETAEHMRSTESAVKAALRRARTKLQMHTKNGRHDGSWRKGSSREDNSPESNPHDLDADQHDLLSAYLAAFRHHDIPALVQLGQVDTLDAVYATTQVVHLAQAQGKEPRRGDGMHPADPMPASEDARHNAIRMAA